MNFDSRAKQNLDEINKVHEFRRGNIREMQPEKSNDLFDYKEEEHSRRYDALKLESVFRFESTYKALKWGIAVGGMFAFHRYYRSRNLNAAAHWFTVMSAVSFFNIWLSYSLQEFVTDYGSRQSVSASAHKEYHQNAYKHYIDRIQDEIHSVDSLAEPMMQNDMADALDNFSETLTEYL